jgi:phi13 family phage major tail protein
MKTVVFNVLRIVYAKVLKDDSTAYYYDAIKTLGDPMQVQLAYTMANAPWYGGGVKRGEITKITGAELQVDITKVSIETKADILGHEYASGVMTVNKKDQAPNIAVGYEMEATEGNREFVWLFKGKARPFGKNVQQSTDNINISTDALTIGFSPREFGGDLYVNADTSNADFTESVANTFLDTVPGGTLVTEG